MRLNWKWNYPIKSLECLCFNRLVERVGCCRIYLFLLENATESDRQDLMSELSIMKKLPPHRHIVKLLGCVTTSGILSSDKKMTKLSVGSQEKNDVFDLSCSVKTAEYYRLALFFVCIYG